MAGIELRQATLDDIPDILQVGELAHAEAQHYQNISFSIPKTALHLVQRINDGFAVVIEFDGKVVGAMTAYTNEHYFSHDMMTMADVIYVLPEYRGKGVLKLFADAYNAWGEEVGADFQKLGVSSGIDTERTAAAMMRLGYEVTGIVLRRVKE